MRIFSLVAAAVLAASMLVGCGKDDAKPAAGAGGGGAPAAETIKIAVIPKATTDEFWKSIHAGAAKAQQEFNAKGGSQLEIDWQGPVIENDSAKQISVVENMINSGANAIVLAPNDTNALAEVVDTASKKGIPVIILDSAVNTDSYKAFVATDNLQGGVKAGEEMIKLLGGKGNVIVLRHDKGQLSTEQREKGFIDTVTAAGIKVVSSDIYGGPTGDTSHTAAENLLAGFKNPDNTLKVDGIFASNEGATYGMLLALRDLKQTGKVKFIGFDASKALVDGLKAGEIDGLVVQDPVNMGYLGVKSALAILDGKTVERKVDTGSHVATKQNMDTQEIKDLLYPPLDKYLKN